MFRIVNEQDRQLIDIQVELAVSMLKKQSDGKTVRRYYGLKLERSKVNFFLPIGQSFIQLQTKVRFLV